MPINQFGIRYKKNHRGGSWWAARQLEKRDRARGRQANEQTKNAAKAWWDRYVAELESIGVIVGEPQKNGNVDLQVPLAKKAQANAITARYAVAGAVQPSSLAELILSAWRERFADVATLHLIRGATRNPDGTEGEALVIGVELTADITDAAALEIMRTCAALFGFPPGVQSCSLVATQPKDTGAGAASI